MKERLKELREELGLSQKKFGEEINLSQNHICALEKGTREITRRVAIDICNKFSINLEWFLYGTGEKHKDILDDFDFEDEEVKEFVRLFIQADDETKTLIKGLIRKTLENNKE